MTGRISREAFIAYLRESGPISREAFIAYLREWYAAYLKALQNGPR